MNFWQRLLRYLIGFAIGCLLVYLMFPDRDWLGWTPRSQIREQINTFSLHISDRASCQLKCSKALTGHAGLMRLHGKVDFSGSEVHEGPKTYAVDYQGARMQVALQDSIVTLIDIRFPTDTCNCP